MVDIRRLRAAQVQAEAAGLDAGPNALGAPLAAATAMDTLVASGALSLDERYTTEIAATAAVASARVASAAAIPTSQATQRPSTVIDPGFDARATGAPPLQLGSSTGAGINPAGLLIMGLGALLLVLIIVKARRK